MNEVIQRIIKEKLVAVIRATSFDEAINFTDTLIEGGFKVIEITYTTPLANEVINQLTKRLSDILIGAGTVLDLKTCKEAIESGAKFIVSPGFSKDCATYCKEVNVPYIPGTMTVTEIMNAMKYGVELFKLFPGSVFKPSFIKAIHGPLPNALLMPTGGVSLENIEAWFENGACAVGVGSSLTKYAKNNDYKKFLEVSKEYVKKVKE